jgi:predicted AAA+ superfamily ATPase
MVKNYRRILEAPGASFFLFGPRGTGKSTWLRRAYQGAYIVDLLDEARYQSYLANAGLFAAELRALEPKSLVILDEVQRLPALLNEVHRFMEEKELRFVLCGSSARKIRRGGVNLLGGRAAMRYMHPFVPEELGGDFSLDDLLRWGSLPVVWSSPGKKETLEAYVQMYLKEEIQAEAVVRNLPGFSRFLPVAALFHGQVLNVSSLSRDAGVARTTAVGYLDIIEDTLLAFRLRAFEGRMRVRERKHPKLFWVDPGIPRALKKQFDPPGREEFGHLFEGWIAGVLRAYGDYRDLFDDWYYWAPSGSSRVEVDFLLRKGDEFAAIEVKSTRTFDKSTLKGLRAIAELKGLRRRILLYLGDRRLQTADGIHVLPLDAFLEAVETGRLFTQS